MIERLKLLFRSPLAWVVILAGVVRIVGIGWGLPSSDGWDNDGVAPRDFLAGLVETFVPGHFYTYPPVHLALLAVLTLPVTVVALVRAPSLSQADVVGEILKVPYMTANAYVARAVSLAMSLASIVLVARIAEELRAARTGDRDDPAVARAGVCAGAFAAVNLSATYYAHTSNLDTPYLFWALASLLVLVRATTRQDPRRLRRAFVLAVLSVATKDQAFGLFLYAYPIALGAFVAFDPWAKTHRREVLREIAIAAGLAVAVFLVADAVVFNPTGFRARLAFLSGSASKDFITYANDWTGRARMLRDAAKDFDHYYPVSLTLIGLAGLAVQLLRAPRRIASWLPLLCAASYTALFNFTALRTDHRFFMPQSLLLAVYGGMALEPLVFAARRPIRVLAQAALSISFALAIHKCLAVDAQLLYDPRYEAEAWLESELRDGELIETYGNNVYLPRFPAKARVIRVGPEPLDRRNPLPGVTEVQAPFEGAAERRSRFIVLTGGWMWRYLIDPNPHLEPGQVVPPTHARTATDPAGTRFFARLTRSMDEYGVVRGFKYKPYFFPMLDIHASTAREVWIYERKPRT